MLVSDCCGAPARGYEDYGICPDCKEHCEWVDDEEEDVHTEDIAHALYQIEYETRLQSL